MLHKLECHISFIIGLLWFQYISILICHFSKWTNETRFLQDTMCNMHCTAIWILCILISSLYCMLKQGIPSYLLLLLAYMNHWNAPCETSYCTEIWILLHSGHLFRPISLRNIRDSHDPMTGYWSKGVAMCSSHIISWYMVMIGCWERMISMEIYYSHTYSFSWGSEQFCGGVELHSPHIPSRPSTDRLQGMCHLPGPSTSGRNCDSNLSG